jgi:hypothetical protein
MVVTPDLQIPKLGAIRLGMRSTTGETSQWKLWADYKVPDFKYLRDLTISADTNERHERNLNIKFQKEF